MVSFLTVCREVAASFFGGVLDGRTTARHKAKVVGGFIASGLRLAHGLVVGPLGPRPTQLMVLYDFERCPHSRAVREALTELDLDVEVRPCPKGGTRFRPDLKGAGVPLLYDPNAQEWVKGSSAIVAHLYRRYGARPAPFRLINATFFRVVTGIAARVLTRHRGAQARPSTAPNKPLELASFESSPYCRMVRFTLCELELPYVLHNLGKGSPRRPAFIARSSKMQLPWLFDPNTGWQSFETVDINRYLEATYGHLAHARSHPP